MAVERTLLAAVMVLFAVALAAAQQQDVHSLKGPFTLPYWSVQGDAQVTENYVRLAEDRQNKRGSLWNVVPNMFANWEATVSFRIHGVSAVGADGLAFWYTDRINKPGTLFGNDEYFNGVGVVIDTYDNDGAGVHPYVMMLQNDGTKKFNHEHEHGVHKEGEGDEIEIGGCTLHVRNLEKPSTLRITYYNRRLTVESSLEDVGFNLCIDIKNIDLPPGYYFGFTAATGQLADNHDIHRFVVRGLDQQGKPQDMPVCGEGSEMGRALSQVQHELAETKKQLESLINKLPSALSAAGQSGQAGFDGSALLQSNVDDLRRSVERNQQSLDTRLVQLDRAVASMASLPRDSEGGSSLLTWVTCFMVILCCGATVFFQYKTYLRRKQKFF